MSSEHLDGQQHTEASAGMANQPSRNDVVSWQNRSANGTMTQTAETTPAEAGSVKIKEQNGAGAAPAAVAGRQPFSMSYGGVSHAEYIRYRVSRGAR